jgi:curved DNA-binding protein CbpA
MQLEDCYRLLDLDSAATDEEVKTAWRDLTKVWHPDRFGHDRDVQRKAEEKLKAINEAYERVRAHVEGAALAAWTVRLRRQGDPSRSC